MSGDEHDPGRTPSAEAVEGLLPRQTYYDVRERNRRAVEAAIGDLRGRFETVPVATYAVENDLEYYRHGRERVREGFADEHDWPGE